MPVSASGDRLARSSSAMRTSSSQSMSSGAAVTRPSQRFASAPSGLPMAAAGGFQRCGFFVEAARRRDWPLTIGQQAEVDGGLSVTLLASAVRRASSM
jgi:hypothetical protein